MPAPDPSVVLVDGPWTHRSISANGARFHVSELGDGPLVLLLHGFPLFWWTWRHQMETLADAGYRAVAMDLRGYGASDKPPRGYDPFTLTADVAGVIRSLGHPDAVVVGHGWGGLLGWTCAVLKPHVVRRLVVVSAPHPRRLRAAMLDRRQVAAARVMLGFQRPWVPERQLVRDDGALVERLLRSWAAAAGWPDEQTALRYRRAIQVEYVAHSALEYHRWAFRSVPRPDGIRFARTMRTPVKAPVLQVHGALDPVVLPRSAAGSGQYVAAPHTWCLLEGTGHFAHEEAPAAFDKQLLAWLG